MNDLDEDLKALQMHYSEIHIGFSQIHFDKHLLKYYLIKDLSQKKCGKQQYGSTMTASSSMAAVRNGRKDPLMRTSR